MTKITKREMFEAIKGLAESGALHMQDFNEAISDSAVIAFCGNEIALLDKKAEKAKENAAKKKADGDELTDAVLSALTEDFATIAEITSWIEGEDVTQAKVSYRLTQLCKTGKAVKEQITVDGGEGKKNRKVMGYRIA